MSNLGNLTVSIGADIQEFNNNLQQAQNRMSRFTESFGTGIGAGIGMAGFDTVVSGMKEVATMGWEFNKSMENSLASFTVMMGGSELEAQKMLSTLNTMAATTPFETTDLTKNAQLLMNFGVEASKVEPTLQMLGDVAMGNAEKFNGLTLAFAQVQSTGKLTGEDLAQMVERGFNPLLIMSKKTGKSMADLKEDVSKGKISADDVAEAFKIATTEGGMFFNSMKTASSTFSGQMSSLTDGISVLLGTVLKPLFEWVSSVGLPALNSGIAFLQNLINTGFNLSQFSALQTLLQTLKSYWQMAMSDLKPVFDSALKTFDVFMQSFQQNFAAFEIYLNSFLTGVDILWQTYGENVLNIFKIIWEQIKAIFINVFGVIEGLLKVFTGIFTLNWSTFLNGLTTIGTNLWNLIKTSIQNALKLIVEVIKIAWKSIELAISPVVNWLNTNVKPIFNVIYKMFDVTLGLILLRVREVWTQIKEYIMPTYLWFKDTLGKIFEIIKTMFNSSLEKIQTETTTAWQNVKNAVLPIYNWFNDTLAPIFQTIKTALSNAWGEISGIASSVWDETVKIIKIAINKIIGFINTFIDAINSIKIDIPKVTVPGLGDFGGYTIRFPTLNKIPMLAEGGIINKPTLAMVGEKGPEAVIPLSKLNGINKEINVIIELDSRILARATAPAMVKELRLQGV
jgi:tape measure domain-containing protein